MVAQKGITFRPTDIVHRAADKSVFVVEQANHRVSKWLYTDTSFTSFRLAAGELEDPFSGNITAGVNYLMGSEIFLPPPDLDIANPVQATAEVLTIDTGGEILTVQINNPGNGYSGTTVTSTDIDDGTGGEVEFNLVEGWGSDNTGVVGTPGSRDPNNPLDDHFYNPTGVWLHATRIYVADTFNHRFKIINANTGAVTANIGTPGTGDEQLYRPAYLAVSATATPPILVIADSFNHRAVRYDVTVADAPVFVDVATPPPGGFITPNGVWESLQGLNFIFVTDIRRGQIAKYDLDAVNFEGIFGEPGSSGTEVNKLFLPGSGHGDANGSSATEPSQFADTQNNKIKAISDTGIITNESNEGPLVPGTGTGELYHPASSTGFLDNTHFNLIANTKNNRVDVYDSGFTYHFTFGEP